MFLVCQVSLLKVIRCSWNCGSIDQLKMVCTRCWTLENGLNCGRRFQHHNWSKFSYTFQQVYITLGGDLHFTHLYLLWSVSGLDADIPRCFGDMNCNAVRRAPQLNVDHCSQGDRLEGGGQDGIMPLVKGSKTPIIQQAIGPISSCAI